MSDSSQKVVYDPLIEIINHFASKKNEISVSKSTTAATVEERLKNRIIEGEKKGLDDDLKLAMQNYKPLEIINTILLEGMKVVGDLFGKGEMQLPFVLQSAEVMKTAVAYLEPFMEKSSGSQKGTMVLATVKGDVHDIGKNLVDIILTNNGYKVINLGIKVPVETMLQSLHEHKADAIGMSGLLVKSTLIMKENLEVMAERGIQVPVLLGGAALTRRYVEEDLRSVYEAPLFYCEDAFSGLRVMERIASGEPLRAETQADVLTQPATTVAETIKRIRIVRHQWNKALDYITDLDFVVQNTFGRWSVRDVIAHFIGWERILIERLGHVKNNNAEGVAVFTDEGVDEVNTQWVTRFKESDRSEVMDEWNAAQSDLQHIIQSLTDSMLASQARGRTVSEIIADSSFAHEYEHLQKVQSWLQTFQTAPTSTVGVPRVRSDVKPSSSIPNPPFWGDRVVEDISLSDIFPFVNEVALFRGQWQFTRGKMSGSEYQSFVDAKVRPVFDAWKKRALEEKLLIPKVVYGYFPCQSDWNDLVIYENDHTTEKLRFTFPRQSDNHHYCISDFFAPKESGKMDVIGCMLVTVGQQASDFSAQLFESDNYADYLYFHGLSVETAEALAEYWHRQMRLELGIVSGDHSDTKKLFQQSYQGSRYSFGYPACPHLEDQSKLFTLLDPKRIGITLTDEYHLVPEQSTSAIIVHHPEAKYFNI